MRANLLQTYTTPDKPSRDLDIRYELSNRTFIKPLPPKGHLVNNTILDAPAVAAKHFAYDMKSLAKAAKGQANDHELGKINDIGLKLGGLAIASYLMTRKQTPLTKVMEFVGLGSFLLAMDLWPKIALQLPAKLVHGFNIRQKYEDSFGREKLFFQDPQYLPFDMYDDKKINNIGNYMGVPKDMPNRREFIQEKMRKTAIQNNTLWMLTAGFATPIMSALICNLSEKPINKYLDKQKEKIADAIPKNFPEEAAKHLDKQYIENLDRLFEANKDALLTPELVNKIKASMSSNMTEFTAKALGEDLDAILRTGNQQYIVDKKVVEQIIDNCQKALSSHFSPEQIASIIPERTRIMSILESDNLLNSKLAQSELQKVFADIGREIKLNAKKMQLDNKSQMLLNGTLFNQKFSQGPITSALTLNPQNKLSTAMIEELRKIATTLNSFNSECAALNKYVYLKLAKAPETNLANIWNDVMDSLLKALKISDKEIADTRYDSKIMNKLFREKLEAISSDENEYKRVVEILSNKISQIDERMKGFDTSATSKESYVSLLNSTFDGAAEKLKNSCPKTARSLVGQFKDEPQSVVDSAGSLKNVYKMYVENRLTGVRSSLYRILNSLDVFRRISTKQFGDILDSKMPLEVKEELIEMIKNMATEGKIADFLTKFYVLRNPSPNTETGDVVIEHGKVVNKYFKPKQVAGKVDLNNDMTFFQNVMKFLFQEEMHSDTKQIIDSTILSSGFRSYRQKSLEALTNHKYFFKPSHVLSNIDNYTLENKFLITGMPLDKMASKAGRTAYNTGRWFKMFGGIGAGLLGITLVSQFFFGKMQNTERSKN